MSEQVEAVAPSTISPRETLARLAYGAYGATTNNLNYQGNPMPSWQDLPPTIQEAWKNAAAEVALTIASAIAENVE